MVRTGYESGTTRALRTDIDGQEIKYIYIPGAAKDYGVSRLSVAF